MSTEPRPQDAAHSAQARPEPEVEPGSLILEMRNISKEFPGVKALADVSMAVRRGEVHAICGENGAGKSTLMKVLSGVWPAGTYGGEILYEGKVVEFNNIRDSEHAGIVIIHQELALIPELSIAENIFLGNEVTSGGVINWVTTRQRASRAARPGRASRRTPTRRSRTSGSASSSWSRSPRRCRRTSTCSSSTSPPRPSTRATRSTCSTSWPGCGPRA